MKTNTFVYLSACKLVNLNGVMYMVHLYYNLPAFIRGHIMTINISNRILTISILFIFSISLFSFNISAANGTDSNINTLYDGSNNLTHSGVPGTVNMISGEETGANDGPVYRLTSIANLTTGTSDSAKTCIEPFDIYNEQKQRVFEMSFMLPQDSQGIRIYGL